MEFKGFDRNFSDFENYGPRDDLNSEIDFAELNKIFTNYYSDFYKETKDNCMKDNGKSFEQFGRTVITSHNIDDLVDEIGKQINVFGRSLQNVPDELLSENCKEQAYLIKTKIILLRKELDDLDDILDSILNNKGDNNGIIS